MLTEDPPARENKYRGQPQSRVGCKAECGSQGPAQEETSDLTPEGQAPGTTGTSGQREGAAGLRREEAGRVRAEGPGMTVGETQSIGEGFSFRETENGAVQAKSNMIQVNCYK